MAKRPWKQGKHCFPSNFPCRIKSNSLKNISKNTRKYLKNDREYYFVQISSDTPFLLRTKIIILCCGSKMYIASKKPVLTVERIMFTILNAYVRASNGDSLEAICWLLLITIGLFKRNMRMRLFTAPNKKQCDKLRLVIRLMS